jgi:hypothetical protein
MKTKKWAIGVLVLALLAAYYVLGTSYLKQHRENQDLARRIDEVAHLLAQVPPAPADLEQRLDEAQDSYAATLDSFPALLNTTQIVDDVLRLAEELGVKAVPLITQPQAVENTGGNDYALFRVNFTVTGDLTGVVEFINRLETSAPSTLVVKSALVERSTDPETDESAPFEASLETVVYARPLSPNETLEAE